MPSAAQNERRLVALLRGVNVGGRNRLAMATLRSALDGLGYTDVKTHLQSGNVVLRPAGDSPERAAQRIEELLASELGVAVPVLVRDAAALQAIVDANPLADVADNPSRLLVTFLSASADESRLADLDPSAFEPDRFVVAGREIYVWAPNGVSETDLTYAFWEKRLGVTATARNWNTVTKLLALARE